MSATTALLQPHPRSRRDAVQLLRVAVDRDAAPGFLRFRYRVEGTIDRLRLPMPEVARRRDGLWHHTCFEAFLQPDASQAYYEFNFAPSGEWAAYRFGGRRSERRLPDLPAPSIEVRRDPGHCELTATVSLAALPELAGATQVCAGIAAVIENGDGAKSYWALAHTADEPDFHDPATFTLRLVTP
jgi:hypothetical protein